MIKKYYIIEPLDIDGDSNPDGFLVSQYKLDKFNNKIFLKNKYITYSKLNNYIKKGGNSSYSYKKNHHNNNHHNNQNMIVLTPEQYNAFMNNKNPQQYPFQHQNQHQNHNYQQQHQYSHQYPPPVMIRNNHSGSFGSSLTSGFGIGIGAAAGSTLFDSIAGMFSG